MIIINILSYTFLVKISKIILTWIRHMSLALNSDKIKGLSWELYLKFKRNKIKKILTQPTIPFLVQFKYVIQIKNIGNLLWIAFSNCNNKLFCIFCLLCIISNKSQIVTSVCSALWLNYPEISKRRAIYRII